MTGSNPEQAKFIIVNTGKRLIVAAPMYTSTNQVFGAPEVILPGYASEIPYIIDEHTSVKISQLQTHGD